MEIRCKQCKVTYDCAKEDTCPNCGARNSPFRSAGARGNMEDYGWGEHLEKRAERLSHEKKPSFIRNMIPYLQIIVVVFGIGIAGTLLTSLAKNVPDASSPAQEELDKPPILQLASATFQATFQPAYGVQLTVDCTGRIPKEKLGQTLRPGEQCVFVDLVAIADDRAQMKDFFAQPYLLYGETVLRPVDLRGAADLADYTPFDYTLLKTEMRVSGQLFFILPEEATTFSLRVPTSPEIEQEAALHV